MLTVNSQRAKKILQSPRFFVSSPLPGMREFPSDLYQLQVLLESEQGNVKNLSFYGSTSEGAVLVLESMASLLIGKKVSLLNDLSIRECEAFLRDRNSVAAFEGMESQEEDELKRFFNWLRHFSLVPDAKDYQFTREKGPFARLSLVDKVRELKAFLNSPEVHSLYPEGERPELLDIEDLTVYVQVAYGSERERASFEKLHLLGAETFQEESLNFIPES